jgi:hypothetical protein
MNKIYTLLLVCLSLELYICMANVFPKRDLLIISTINHMSEYIAILKLLLSSVSRLNEENTI